MVAASDIDDALDVKRHCTPRVTRVNLPEPLGPKLFILGEPVLHRYYTVYDWANLQVGFGLSNSRQNVDGGLRLDGKGSLPDNVEMLLMQQTMTSSYRRTSEDSEEDDEDELLFIQVTVSVVIQQKDVDDCDAA